MEQTARFAVRNGSIHCEGCEQRIGKALGRQAGVKGVEASANTQQVRVRFDPDLISEEQLSAKLEQAGFANSSTKEDPQ